VIAHLTGDRLGGPSRLWATELRSHPHSELRCAIGAAVAAAVSRRDRYIRRWYASEELTRHVSALLRRQLADGSEADEPDLRWRVAQYRWSEVIRALRTPPGPGEDTARSHPRIDYWAQHGLVVTGSTWIEQLRDAGTQLDRDWVSPVPLLGGVPVVLGDLAAAIEPSADPASQLVASVSMLGLETNWLTFRLEKCLEEHR
jgi:hypothetical protein